VCGVCTRSESWHDPAGIENARRDPCSKIIPQALPSMGHAGDAGKQAYGEQTAMPPPAREPMGRMPTGKAAHCAWIR
jgi:hypothetical protein